jgi:hypothetical protein
MFGQSFTLQSSFCQEEKEMMITSNNILISFASFKGFRANNVEHICWLKHLSI